MRGYDHNLALLTDQALLAKAGLGSSYTGETSTLDYADYIYFTPVPEPSSLMLVCIATLMALPLRRKFAKRAAYASPH